MNRKIICLDKSLLFYLIFYRVYSFSEKKTCKCSRTKSSHLTLPDINGHCCITWVNLLYSYKALCWWSCTFLSIDNHKVFGCRDYYDSSLTTFYHRVMIEINLLLNIGDDFFHKSCCKFSCFLASDKSCQNRVTTKKNVLKKM